MIGNLKLPSKKISSRKKYGGVKNSKSVSTEDYSVGCMRETLVLYVQGQLNFSLKMILYIRRNSTTFKPSVINDRLINVTTVSRLVLTVVSRERRRGENG